MKKLNRILAWSCMIAGIGMILKEGAAGFFIGVALIGLAIGAWKKEK